MMWGRGGAREEVCYKDSLNQKVYRFTFKNNSILIRLLVFDADLIIKEDLAYLEDLFFKMEK